MSLSKLSHSTKLVLGASIVFFIVSFFNWQEVSFGPISAGASMWHGWGVVAGLVVMLLIIWEGLRLASIPVRVGTFSPPMVTAGLGALLLLTTLLKVLVDNDYRTAWAWLGLALAAVVGFGAWTGMKASAE